MSKAILFHKSVLFGTTRIQRIIIAKMQEKSQESVCILTLGFFALKIFSCSLKVCSSWNLRFRPQGGICRTSQPASKRHIHRQMDEWHTRFHHRRADGKSVAVASGDMGLGNNRYRMMKQQVSISRDQRDRREHSAQHFFVLA